MGRRVLLEVEHYGVLSTMLPTPVKALGWPCWVLVWERAAGILYTKQHSAVLVLLSQGHTAGSTCLGHSARWAYCFSHRVGANLFNMVISLSRSLYQQYSLQFSKQKCTVKIISLLELCLSWRTSSPRHWCSFCKMSYLRWLYRNHSAHQVNLIFERGESCDLEVWRTPPRGGTATVVLWVCRFWPKVKTFGLYNVVSSDS